MKTHTIRKFQSTDKSQVENIHFETGFVGKSMSSIFDNRKEWAKGTKYYIKKEPESIFVLENVKSKKVVGYVFGCLNDKNNNEINEGLKDLFRRIFLIPFSSKKDRKFIKSRIEIIFKIISGKSGELKLKTPKNAGHLHINLLPEARGNGNGSKLLKKFETYAKSKGVKTIHAGSFYTTLNPNENFWKKNNYKIYSEEKTLFWKSYYPKEEMTLRIYYKKL